MKIPIPTYSTRKALVLMMVCVILGLSASWGIAEYTQKVGEFVGAAQELTPEERAKEAFMQTHTEPVVEVFRIRETETKYLIAVYYPKWLNDSEGDFLFYYRIDYDVYKTGEVEPSTDAFVDLCDSWVVRFIGDQPVTSKQQANQTYFMLIHRSPLGGGERNWINPLFCLYMNITELPDRYRESAAFHWIAVKTPYMWLTVSYDLYKNGTAVITSEPTTLHAQGFYCDPTSLQPLLLSTNETDTESPELTPEEAAIEQAKQAFMQTHTEPIAYVHVYRKYETEPFIEVKPVYFIAIYYCKWLNDSDGDFLFHFRTDYIVQAGEITSGPIGDSCYSWVIHYIGDQPITSKEQANQTFFMLLNCSPFNNWKINLHLPLLSLNITETPDCYQESVMFHYVAVNMVGAKLILSYDIYKNGTAIFIGEKEIFPPPIET